MGEHMEDFIRSKKDHYSGSISIEKCQRNTVSYKYNLNKNCGVIESISSLYDFLFLWLFSNIKYHCSKLLKSQQKWSMQINYGTCTMSWFKIKFQRLNNHMGKCFMISE